MSDRAAFARTLTRNRRRIDAERREFAERAVEAIQQGSRGRERYDPLAHALTMRDLERVLDTYYGRYPGDESARFWTLILDESRLTRRERFAASWRMARGILQRKAPDVLRALRASR